MAKNQSSVYFDSRLNENDKQRIAQFEDMLKGENDDLLNIPADFTEKEATVYFDLVSYILKSKVIPIGNIDKIILEQLAFNIVQLRINRDLLREEGSVIQMVNNKCKVVSMKNPRHQVVLDLSKEIKSLYSSLGLDLPSRNKLARDMNNLQNDGLFEDDGLWN
ncbi:hypothetical protein GMB34_11695 [Turicibacter sanguinis]|nr:hypothetical protein [Turicibacter sanguinis]MTN84856.1 hypothetical protein [Turicibacter sanguinis]MTN87678.1 hypothetical protein [Turicibacter sanguinis]MTN90500.1 hypothetical protein [Turicibacter sanguinis]MTN93422.1 hypothetical protein [Turicibacter sanguinis]